MFAEPKTSTLNKLRELTPDTLGRRGRGENQGKIGSCVCTDMAKKEGRRGGGKGEIHKKLGTGNPLRGDQVGTLARGG